MLWLSEEDREHLGMAVHRAVKDVHTKLNGNSVGVHGYFRLFLLPDSASSYAELIPLEANWIEVDVMAGEINDKTEIISFEKATRLAKNHIKHGHMTSWQSRNPDDMEYGGAIIIHAMLPGEQAGYVRLLFSFSGLTEMGDEAAMIAALIHTGWEFNYKPDLEIILSHGDNSLAKAIVDEYI